MNTPEGRKALKKELKDKFQERYGQHKAGEQQAIAKPKLAIGTTTSTIVLDVHRSRRSEKGGVSYHSCPQRTSTVFRVWPDTNQHSNRLLYLKLRSTQKK